MANPFSTYELVTLGFWSSLRAIFRGARIELYQRVSQNPEAKAVEDYDGLARDQQRSRDGATLAEIGYDPFGMNG